MKLFGHSRHEEPASGEAEAPPEQKSQLLVRDERTAATEPRPPLRGQHEPRSVDAEPLAENVSETGRRDTAPVGHSTDHGVWPMLKRTYSEFKEDGLTDWAAALTYYG